MKKILLISSVVAVVAVAGVSANNLVSQPKQPGPAPQVTSPAVVVPISDPAPATTLSSTESTPPSGQTDPNVPPSTDPSPPPIDPSPPETPPSPTVVATRQYCDSNNDTIREDSWSDGTVTKTFVHHNQPNVCVTETN